MTRTFPLLLLGFSGAARAAEGAQGGDPTLTYVALAVMVGGSLALLAWKRAWGLVAASLCGIVLAAVLTIEHNAPASTKILACASTETVSCEQVNTSQWSELFGIPIALLGLAYFATVGFFAIRHALGRAPLAPVAIAALAGLAVAYDVFLAVAMFAWIGKICPLCIATWVLNVLLLVGGLLEWRRIGTPFGSALTGALKDGGDYAAIVGLATLVVGGLAFRKGDAPAVATPDQGGRVEDLAQFYELPMGTIQLDGTEPVYGDPGAPYTLVEFADYECPHCAEMAVELKRVLAQNKDVKLLFKHFPLAPTCNKHAPYGRHEDACNAAAAAECARLQGRFWEMNEKMFANQQYLGKDDLRFMAGQIGLDMPAFEACMADPKTAEAVIADTDAGGAAHVEGTPSIFARGLFGDRWVRITGGEDAMNAIFAVARSGTKLPDPQPSAHQPH